MVSVKKADFDTVHDLQQAYKKMLYALSYPGKIYNVSELSEKISLNFDYNKSLLLLALCIADSEVTISITGDNSNNESAGNYLRNIAYTNIDENRIPDYLILSGDFNVENITDTIAIGTLIDPHKSTTVFIEVEKISDTAQYELSGPGIKDKTNISIDGIFDEFIRLRNTKCRKFPLGFDIFVCDKVGNIIGIPRTTKIDEGSM